VSQVSAGEESGKIESVDIAQTLVSTTSIVAVLFYAAILFDGGRTASRHIRAGEPQWAWGATFLAVGIILANEIVARWERWHSIFGWPPLFAPTLAACLAWAGWAEIRRQGAPAGWLGLGIAFFLSGSLFTQSLLGVGVKFQPLVVPLLGLVLALAAGLMGWALFERNPLRRSPGFLKVASGSFGLGLWLVVSTWTTVFSIRWH